MRYKMIKKRYFKYLLLIVMAILAIGLAGITGCAEKSPFVPEFIQPPDMYYIEMTPVQIDEAMLSDYNTPLSVQREWEGKSLIVKNITVNEVALSTLHEGYIFLTNIKCIPLRPTDLLALKKGDVVDIVGVFADVPLIAGARIGFITLASCQFLPAGLYPLPLPGGAAPPGGY
jgi:hypothetical protein